MKTKEKLALVKKYLDTGRIETKDSLSLGIDPWDFPNYSELYVKRLALIVEELITFRDPTTIDIPMCNCLELERIRKCAESAGEKGYVCCPINLK